MSANAKGGEFLLLGVVALLSVAANLPEAIIGKVVDQKVLLLALSAVVIIALFRHLRILFFLSIIVLAIGANMPQRMADSLGVSQPILLGFLAAVVFIAILNRFFFRLPPEREEALEDLKDTLELRKAILTAITRSNVKRLKWFLRHKANFDFVENGQSPAIVAAETGNSEVMQLLIYNRVNVNVVAPDGRTPLQIAESLGFVRTAEIIKFALEHLERPDVPEAGLANRAA